MPDDETPTPPEDLGASGRAFWLSLAGTFDFEEHELAVVEEAARVKDRLDELDAVVRSEGVTVESPQGVKAHPALVEARAQEVVLTRLVASLRLPDENDVRPQRRGGGRGAYSARRDHGQPDRRR
jgi:hypothetical protein